ncbi:MAG: alpha/beta hydrolase [Caulobacter sp.]
MAFAEPLYFLVCRDRQKVGGVRDPKMVRDFRDRKTGGWPSQDNIVKLPERHFSVEFGNEWSGRLWLITHGFNVNGPSGASSCGEMVREGFGADLVMPVLWPGDWYVRGVNYPFELGDAVDTGRRLATWLCDNVPKAEVSIISHSLGARVALSAAAELAVKKNAPRMGQLILMAAAADHAVLEWPAYREGLKRFKSVTVLASVEDEVLKDAYPIGDKLENFWWGERGSGVALGLEGPRTQTIPGLPHLMTVRIPADRKHEHGSYLPSPLDPPPNAWRWGWDLNRLSARNYLVKRTYDPFTDFPWV